MDSDYVEDDDVPGDMLPVQSVWQMAGSLVAGGAECFEILIAGVLVGLEGCMLMTFPVAGALNPVVSWTYWMFTGLIALSTLALVFYAIGIARASLGMLTTSIIIFIANAICHFFMAVWLGVVAFTCKDDVMCDKNMNALGERVAPWDGPSVRFIVVAAVTLLSAFLNTIAVILSITNQRAIGAYASHLARRSRDSRRTSEALAAAGYPMATRAAPPTASAAPPQQMNVGAPMDVGADYGMRNRSETRQQRQQLLPTSSGTFVPGIRLLGR